VNILGIDHGLKHIGLAIARSGVKIAYPLSTIDNDDETVTKLQKIIDEEKISTVVLGLPRNLSAEDTDQTKVVRDFQRVLEKHSIQTVFQDETSSTERAYAKGATKADKDAWAAAIILQDYLERA